MMAFPNITGLTVKGIYGRKARKNSKDARAEYILFTDGKTYIELEDQDGYTFHDADFSAKILNVRRNRDMWLLIVNDHGYYLKLRKEPT